MPFLQTPFDYRALEALARRPGQWMDAGELTASAGGTRGDIDRAIDALRRLGYDVEAHPAYGICLRTPADVVDRQEVRERAGTRAIGQQIVCFLEAGSTNDLARQAAAEGAPHGTVFTAEHQTAGRGRLGRRWFSPPGTGLWLSIVLRLPMDVQEAWTLTLGAAVAVAEAAEEAAGLTAGLKWPNDVQVRGRKVAGILTEAQAEGRALSSAVVGIGINVNQEARDFPEDLRETATSMRLATGRAQRRTEVLAALLKALEEVTGDLRPGRIRALWKARSPMLGRRVQVVGEGLSVEGVAEDIAEDGSLCVRRADGGLSVVRAGDVEMVR